MGRTFRNAPWCRYADDGLVHCGTEHEAQTISAALAIRFGECGLEMHPDKTKIVYCKDGSRKGQYPNTKFYFLGYTFRARLVKNRKRNSLFVNFTPAVSSKAVTTMRQTTRKWNFRNRSDLSLHDIARMYNPVLRAGCRIMGSTVRRQCTRFSGISTRRWLPWAMRKFRRLKGHKTRASLFLEGIAKRQPQLFAQWQRGMIGAFA
jgi:RNA-directed DNA polymerase